MIAGEQVEMVMETIVIETNPLRIKKKKGSVENTSSYCCD
jgi:hypothetical protein